MATTEKMFVLELNQEFCSQKKPAFGTDAAAAEWCATRPGWTHREMSAAELADPAINQDITDYGIVNLADPLPALAAHMVSAE
jgi:hypothetical protein